MELSSQLCYLLLAYCMNLNSSLMDRTTNRIQLVSKLLLVGAAIGIGLAQYLVFMVVPNELTMGPMQRIVYFHAASAVASYLAFLLLFIASVTFMVTRIPIWSGIGRAAGEVGLLLCTIVLLTGMIWGKAAWNTWFRFEPRLITFLLLWLLLISYNLMWRFGDQERKDTHLAILGILTSLTVPLMVYSVKLLPNTHQLHPQVVATGGFRDPSMMQALLLSMLALSLLTGTLILIRGRIGQAEAQLRAVEDLLDEQE